MVVCRVPYAKEVGATSSDGYPVNNYFLISFSRSNELDSEARHDLNNDELDCEARRHLDNDELDSEARRHLEYGDLFECVEVDVHRDLGFEFLRQLVHHALLM